MQGLQSPRVSVCALIRVKAQSCSPEEENSVGMDPQHCRKSSPGSITPGIHSPQLSVGSFTGSSSTIHLCAVTLWIPGS